MPLLISSTACLRGVSTETLQSHNIMIPTPGGAGGTPVSAFKPTFRNKSGELRYGFLRVTLFVNIDFKFFFSSINVGL